jgi:hypothetical protein
MQLSRGGKDSKSYTTSSLLKHLTKKHRNAYEEGLLSVNAESQCQQLQTQSTGGTSTPVKQPTLHGFIDRKKLYVSDRIARMIVIDLQPFSIVEDRGFHELLEYLEPRYSMPSR